MRTLLWLAVLGAGCSKTDPNYCIMHRDDVATCGNQSAVDAAPDTTTSVDAIDQHCFGPAGTNFQACLGPGAPPTTPFTLPITIDTTSTATEPRCLDAAHQPAGWTGDRDACFIVASSIMSTSQPTAVVGSRPLVLVAIDSISISQPIDVASHRNASHGPGSNPTSLCTGGNIGGTGGLAGGGGGGGSFQTMGGAGGTGNDAITPAMGGTAGALGSSSTLRGGCSGYVGGGPAGSNSVAGAGGGAIYLVAGTSISITSTINASGAAAFGGTNQSGGGGGGSGGMIALFAPAITATSALIFANGGGGAGGGDGGSNAGESGTDPAMPLVQAAGGTAGSGGDGGKGYANGLAAGAGMGVTAINKSGGGGGGGAGFVISNQALGPMVSPAIRSF